MARGHSRRWLSAVLVSATLVGCDDPTSAGGPLPAEISLSIDSAGFTALGDTIRVSAVAVDASRSPLDVEVSWTSGDSTVVVVSDGSLSATGPGRTEVTASVGAVSASLPVAVDQIADTVELPDDSLQFAALEEADTLRAIAFDRNGFEIVAADVVWLSSDTLVLSIDGSVATARGQGTVDVTAAIDSARSTRSAVVHQLPVALTFSPAPLPPLLTGDTVRVTVQPWDANGFAIEGRTTAVTVADTAIARIDSTALLTGLSEGGTWVRASVGDLADSLALQVGTRVEIVTAALPEGVVGLGYAATITAVGVDSTAVWSVVSGTLPAGLTLSGDGTIQGVPGVAGTFPLDIGVSGSGQSASRPLVLEIRPPHAFGFAYTDTLGVARSGRIRISDDGVDLSVRLEVEDPTIESARILATLYDPRTAKAIDDGFNGYPMSSGSTWTDYTEHRDRGNRTTDTRYGGSVDGSVSQSGAGDSTVVLATKPLASMDSLDLNVSTGDTLHLWVAASLLADFHGTGLRTRSTLECGSGETSTAANPRYVVGTGLLVPVDCPVDVRSWLPEVVTEPDQLWTVGPDGVHAWLEGVARSSNVLGTAVWGVSGSLPAGVDWTPNGSRLDIQGTPTEGGTFDFTVSVTDDRGLTGSRTYTLDIPVPDTVVIHPDSVARGAGRATISSGGHHTCALGPSGDAQCWGHNDNGQLGTGDSIERGVPTPTIGGLTFIELAAGERHTCGLTGAGAAYCWGSNEEGQLGSATGSTVSPVLVGGGLSFSTITAGDFHTCALTTAGAAWCWGSNAQGQLGDGTMTSSSSPVPVGGGAVYARIAGGGHHTCAIVEGGSAECWGHDNEGQLGDGLQVDRSLPAPVAGSTQFVMVTAGDEHSCGLTASGAAWCWGSNLYHALGSADGPGGPSPRALEPVRVGGGKAFRWLSAGDEHACGVASDGGARCWGRNDFNQSSPTPSNDVLLPELVPGGHTLVRVSPGMTHTCGQTSAGETVCWGRNYYGQLGDGSGGVRSTPRPVDGPPGTFDAVSVGFVHSCGLSGGDVFCWGRNDSYQLGWTGGNLPSPARVVTPMSFDRLEVGANFSCALAASGGVQCWGAGWDGQLGHGVDGVRSEVPVDVAGGIAFQQITTGFYHACGLDAAGAAYCWGRNSIGSLGDGTRIGRSSPVPVQGGLVFDTVAAGSEHSCGITPSRDMYCWGRNGNGELGLGTTSPDEITPSLVSGGHSWRAVALGRTFSCGLRTDDTVMCWGVGGSGQLGNGGTSQSTVPTAVSGLMGVDRLVRGWDGACAVLTGGSVSCWGANGLGQLATGDTADALTPVSGPAGGPWSSLSIGWAHGCAVGPGGVASCWGYNESGQLGRAAHVYQTAIPVLTAPY